MLFVFIRNHPCPLVVAGDSDLLRKLDPTAEAELLMQREVDECYLDPGGMLCTQTPSITFKVDGMVFSVKADQIERMLELWESAQISQDYAVVPMWMRRLLLPVEMYYKLYNLLGEAHHSDTALNAELTRNELLMKLYEKGIVVQPPDSV